MKPTIERFKDSLQPRANQPSTYTELQLENQLLYDFKSQAAQFLGNLPRDDERLEWLSVLQHYGTPTRLLDWTYSPTVATYFAMKDDRTSTSEVDQDACVWALNVTMLQNRANEMLGTASLELAYKLVIQTVRPIGKPAVVVPFLPTNRYSRMSGQQGLFLVKTNTETAFMETLKAMNNLGDDRFIRRLLIPRPQRTDMLAHLFEHNTHEVGIFPDADGLGRFVKIKVEIQANTIGLR